MFFTQNGRFLRFDSPIGEDALLLVKVVAKEYFDQPYHLTLQLLSTSPNLSAKALLGQTGKVTLFGEETRLFQGIITQFQPLHFDKLGRRFYQIILQPWITLLDKQSHNRYYYQQSIPQLVRQLGLGLNYQDILTNELQQPYPEFTVMAQYQETDFQFMQRLLTQAKIYYRFLPGDTNETVLLQDTPLDKTHRMVNLQQINQYQQIYPKQIQLKSYQFTHPTQAVKNSQATLTELFYYQHDLENTNMAEDLAKRLCVEQQILSEYIDGSSHAIYLQPGCIYQFTEPKPSQRKNKYIVRTVEHIAWDYSLLDKLDIPRSDEGESVETTYYCNHLQLQASELPLQPTFTIAKPQMSIQTAFVTTPEQKVVYTNPYGAVKIKFPWQATENVNIAHLPWVRVCQWQAGNHWGSQFIPRTGDEVVVGFIHGDLLRPVILGSLYNQQHQPPYALPAQANITALRTQLIGKTIGHELAFDDTLQHEIWQLKVQGTYQQNIEYDQQISIAGDATLTVNQQFITEVLQGKTDIQAHTAILQVGSNTITFSSAGVNFQGKKIYLKTRGVGGTFPVVRQGDDHSCYQLTSNGAHGGGAIYTGSPTLKINQQAAARLGDKAHCLIQADTINQGVANILVDNKPLARVKHKTEHDGLLTAGSANVFVQDI